MGSLFGRVPLMSVVIGARCSPILHSFVHCSMTLPSPPLVWGSSVRCSRAVSSQFLSRFSHRTLSLCHHLGANLVAEAPLLGCCWYKIWLQRTSPIQSLLGIHSISTFPPLGHHLVIVHLLFSHARQTLHQETEAPPGSAKVPCAGPDRHCLGAGARQQPGSPHAETYCTRIPLHPRQIFFLFRHFFLIRLKSFLMWPNFFLIP